MNTYYSYRPIDNPNDLRHGERVVQFVIDTGMWIRQGNRDLVHCERYRLYAERAHTVHSRILKRKFK
jgi:hypothetical protein